MAKKPTTFGKALRDARLAKKVSLRKFAEQVGVSPTYLSQVEQDNITPPTVDRITKMAELLNENADEWITLAGRVPGDLTKIIQNKPTEMPELMREASGLSAEQIRKVTEQIKKLKEKGK